jgi:hypothetical protein
MRSFLSYGVESILGGEVSFIAKKFNNELFGWGSLESIPKSGKLRYPLN